MRRSALGSGLIRVNHDVLNTQTISGNDRGSVSYGETSRFLSSLIDA